jgi:hypothetical protein
MLRAERQTKLGERMKFLCQSIEQLAPRYVRLFVLFFTSARATKPAPHVYVK